MQTFDYNMPRIWGTKLTKGHKIFQKVFQILKHLPKQELHSIVTNIYFDPWWTIWRWGRRWIKTTFNSYSTNPVMIINDEQFKLIQQKRQYEHKFRGILWLILVPPIINLQFTPIGIFNSAKALLSLKIFLSRHSPGEFANSSITIYGSPKIYRLVFCDPFYSSNHQR